MNELLVGWRVVVIVLEGDIVEILLEWGCVGIVLGWGVVEIFLKRGVVGILLEWGVLGDSCWVCWGWGESGFCFGGAEFFGTALPTVPSSL